MGFIGKLFRTKKIQAYDPTRGGGLESLKGSLPRVLNLFDLVSYGVGCIIGAGIFVLAGVAAAERAGPAIALSFLLDGVACILSALAYAEFASRVPSSGSAYSYAYVSVGEFPAWIIGWMLIMEYVLGIATVARGWSGYVQSFVEGLGWELPFWVYRIKVSSIVIIDPLAGFAILFITLIAISGSKKLANFNTLVTFISVVVILFVIIAGAPNVDPDNWLDNFFPFGISGIFAGAATVFFAFIGFDSLANLSEEVQNPKRDVPLGIIISLSLCCVLYIAVSLVLTGMVPYYQIDVASPLATAFNEIGYEWAGVLISIGAFAGLITTMLTLLGSVPKTIFAMGRDGLLPRYFGYVNETLGTPINAILLCAVAGFLLALLVDIELLAELVSIGTLFAFSVVCICVVVLRFKADWDGTGFEVDRGEARIAWLLIAYTVGIAICSGCAFGQAPLWITLPSAVLIVVPAVLLFWFPGEGWVSFSGQSDDNHFKCPLVPVVPMAGIAINVLMITNLRIPTFVGFVAWTVIGLVLYFLYGFFHSRLRAENKRLIDHEDEIIMRVLRH